MWSDFIVDLSCFFISGGSEWSSFHCLRPQRRHGSVRRDSHYNEWWRHCVWPPHSSFFRSKYQSPIIYSNCVIYSCRYKKNVYIILKGLKSSSKIRFFLITLIKHSLISIFRVAYVVVVAEFFFIIQWRIGKINFSDSIF